MSSDHTSPGSRWEPPSVERLQELLPQYEITGILGRGGMGAVYRGRQIKLDRDVAIKVLPETFTQVEDDLQFAKRFELEAKAMAKLDHPAILSVYDFGETEEGQLYFVMEFIDGMDIHRYLQIHGGAIPQEHALAIISHVLDALDYAHSHGVVHRDIKPANVLINSEGRVKIADFGLAKTIAQLGDESSPALTMTHMAIGTPDFVAPEALDRSKVPDHRADLYAVGVMLYQMLTGKVPRGHFKLPSLVRAELDPRLDGIVSKSLQTDPDDRYSTAREIRTDLDALSTSPMTRLEGGEDEEMVHAVIPLADPAFNRGVGGTPPKLMPREKPKAGLYVGIGLAAVVVIGALVTLLTGGGDPPPHHGAPGPAEVGRPIPPASERQESGGEETPAPLLALKAPDTSPEEAPGEAPPDPPSAGEPEVVVNPGNVPQTDPPKIDPPQADGAGDVTEKTETPDQPVPDATGSNLVHIAGFKLRLERYLETRRTRVSDLADKYLRGLDFRLNQAADAGDLKLATAFREEKERVEKLQEDLMVPAADPVAAVGDPASLGTLPEGAPEGVVTLRKTWDTEREKIRGQLDEALQLSLRALEAELTVAREFEKAEMVMAFREGVSEGETVPVAADVEPETPPQPEAPGVVLKNPFGWTPLPDSPFPLKRRERPETPCRLVAWRTDGKPVDELAFRNLFGGVPSDLGDVVDFDALFVHWFGPDEIFPMLLKPDGTVASLKAIPALEREREKLIDVVEIAVGRYLAVALRSDGTVVPLELNQPHLDGVGVALDAANHWEDVVRVGAGSDYLVALTSSGVPLSVGGNQFQQRDFPPGFDRDLLEVALDHATTGVAKADKDSILISRIGQHKFHSEFKRGGRWFFGTNVFVADSRGRLSSGGTLHQGHPHSFQNFPGKQPSDVRDAVSVNHKSSAGLLFGVTAVREAESQWHFWGDLGELCDLDEKYCEERAAGTWKIRLLPPYVLALKPAAHIGPDDWTGAKTATAANPNPDSSPAVDTSKIFPLPIPERPKLAGRLEVYRRDGNEVGSQADDNDLAKLPADLGNKVVAVSVGIYVEGEKERALAVALLNDGTVRVWGSGHGTEVIEDPTLGLRGIVSAAAGSAVTLFLDEKGRPFGAGSGFGDLSTMKAAPIDTPVAGAAVAVSAGPAYLLGTDGSLHLITKWIPQGRIPDGLPPATAIAAGWGGWALGTDGKWRAWYGTGVKRAEFPADGGTISTSANGPLLVWINPDGKPRQYDVKKTSDWEPPLFKEIPNPVQQVAMTSNLIALESRPGEWHITGLSTDDTDHIAKSLRGCCAVAGSHVYVFGIRPLGR